MDKRMVQDVAAEVRVALAEVAERHGMTVTVNGGKYDPEVGTFRPRVEFAEDGAEYREFAMLAPGFGLTAEDYGRVVSVNGSTFRLVGLNPRAPRFPAIGEALDGKRYKLTESALAGLKG